MYSYSIESAIAKEIEIKGERKRERKRQSTLNTK